MREIIRNLTIAFIVLVTLMLFMVYISVIFLLHVWQINPLGVDQFRVWNIISLVSQMLLCLLFNYYFFKMKAFYTPTVLEADKE
jgi:uncharacterized BrkB/YihY/UPF0761 family membrane protein